MHLKKFDNVCVCVCSWEIVFNEIHVNSFVLAQILCLNIIFPKILWLKFSIIYFKITALDWWRPKKVETRLVFLIFLLYVLKFNN